MRQRRLKVELPSIREVWKENAAAFRFCYVQGYSPEHHQHVAGIVRAVRTLISLEEVFGAGLLERHESTLGILAPVKPMEDDQVPCGLCGDATRMKGTERCDRCYELETRIQDNPTLARLILERMEVDRSAEREKIKQRAYKIDPECWVSYSGKPKSFKRYMDGRRTEALRKAEKEFR